MSCRLSFVRQDALIVIVGQSSDNRVPEELHGETRGDDCLSLMDNTKSLAVDVFKEKKSCKSTRFVFFAASHSADTVNLTVSLYFLTQISSFLSSCLSVSLSDLCV